MPVGKKIKRLVIWGVPLLALLFWGLYQAYKEEPATYMTISMSKRDINRQVFATGTLTGSTLVDVGAQVTGQIQKLHYKLGDKVKKGDLLCEIDPKTQENKVKTAQADINRITAQIKAKDAEIKKLKLEHVRQQNLRKKDATSKHDAEAAEAAYVMALAEMDSLQAQYNQSKLSVDDAKTNLGYTKLVSPIDGTIYAVVAEEGQTVNANQTTPTILRIADMETMVVETEISEADVVNVREGMDCTFTVLGLPHKIFKAKLGRIAPAPASEKTSSSSSSSSSSSQAIYYNADLYVHNEDDLLRIDMTADVTINIQSVRDVDAIPLSALRQEHGSKAQVYVLDEEGKVVERQLSLGLRDDQYVQILEGLSAEDKIVIGADVKTAQAQAQAPRRGGIRL